jgi:hypothetical protein
MIVGGDVLLCHTETSVQMDRTYMIDPSGLVSQGSCISSGLAVGPWAENSQRPLREFTPKEFWQLYFQASCTVVIIILHFAYSSPTMKFLATPKHRNDFH